MSGFLGEISAEITSVGENDANVISNIQFISADEKAADKNGVSKALIDTQKKAQTMARSMHIQVDTIPVKVVEDRREETVMLYRFV